MSWPAVRFHAATPAKAAAPSVNVAPSGNNIAPNPYATTAQGGTEGVMAWAQMAAEYGGEAGVPPEFILALIKAESNGNPRAVGDAGHSVGLFQLHDRGVGYGYTVEERYDPALQFQLMMPRIAAAYNAGVAKGLSGRQLAMFVGQQAERPAVAPELRGDAARDGADPARAHDGPSESARNALSRSLVPVRATRSPAEPDWRK